MKNIKLPKWLPHDKFKHFVLGVMIMVFISLSMNPYFGISITIIVAALKEYYDYKNDGDSSWSDFFWTITLPLTAFIIYVI